MKRFMSLAAVAVAAGGIAFSCGGPHPSGTLGPIHGTCDAGAGGWATVTLTDVSPNQVLYVNSYQVTLSDADHPLGTFERKFAHPKRFRPGRTRVSRVQAKLLGTPTKCAVTKISESAMALPGQ